MEKRENNIKSKVNLMLFLYFQYVVEEKEEDGLIL